MSQVIALDPHPYTIEYRHVIAAIPGDTLRQKFDWVQARADEKLPTCDCRCNDGIDVIGKVREVVSVYKARLREDSSMVYCVDDMNKIAEIVASPCACGCGGDCSGANGAARAMSKALGEIDGILDWAECDAKENDNYYDYETVVMKIKAIVAGVE
jgi:hypothetical protein